MGNGGSIEKGTALKNFYQSVGATINDNLPAEGNAELLASLQQYCGAGNGVMGGFEASNVASYLGGYDQLQNYGDSVFSRAKEKLIRAIAGDVFSALKLQGSKYAQNAPIGDVVKHLEKIVPNPRKGDRFNKAFNKSSGKQSDVCKALGHAINKHYAGNLVPMDATEGEICNKVAEVMHSLFTGLHTEFMSVAGDVLRIIRNLETLKEFINASYKRQAELVASSGDQQLKMQSSNVEDFYKRIMSELERQLAVLSNLVNVAVGPTSKSLIGLLEDNRDFSGLVKDLKGDLGTNAFGDKLAYLLSGVSSVAHSAELIDKALKKIGMSVSEFKNSKGAQDLRLKIYDHIQKKSPTSKELDAMMAAAEIIYKNDYSHKAVADVLSKKGRGEALGGDCGCSGGDSYADGGRESDDELADMRDRWQGYSDGGDVGAYGGLELGDLESDEKDDELTAYWSKKSLSKKITKKAKYRDLILKDFKKLLRQHYGRIVEASDQIAKHIGTTIPASDDLDKFINIFSMLPNLDRENLHIALSGYPKDSTSREQRDNFLNQYHLVDVAIEPLVKGPGGQYFKAVQAACRDLVKAIDNFSDKIVKSITEIHIDKPEEIRAELQRTASRFFGAANGGGDSGEDMFGTGSFVEFDKVKNEMRYFYSIAHIKTNLSRVADEMKEFGDDYEQVLGEEAAYIIDSIRKEYQALLDDANPAAQPPHTVPIQSNLAMGVRGAGPAAAVVNTAVGTRGYVGGLIFAAAGPGPYPAGVANQEQHALNMYNNLKELYTRQMNAKVKMVEVAQAIDLYLRSFADGIARNPEMIKSVVKMLDQVEIVGKWFTDKSGNNLSSLFEFFPAGMNNAGAPIYSTDNENIPITADGKDTNVGENKDHYYAWVEEQAARGANPHLPGNPFLGRPIPFEKNKVKGVLQLSVKTITSMRALENILSVFGSVGSDEPQTKTFMTPGQIFNALCEYIIMSAFTTGFLPHAVTTSAVYKGSVPAALATIDAGLVRATVAGGNLADGVLHPSEEVAVWKNADPNGVGVAAPVSVMAGNGNLVGISNVANAVNLELNKYTSVAMSAIPAYRVDAVAPHNTNFWEYHNVESRTRPRLDAAGWLDRFYDTDLLFQSTIKSIVCKVFTVVDAYRLFNRPLTEKNRTQYDSLTPLRTILGGAAGGDVGTYGGAAPVKVIPDALELYLRLPLLAEWYREKFNTELGRTTPPLAPGNQVAGWRLTLVPSIDGIWSGLINLIFDKANYVGQGNYTEPQAKKLIEEINDIYKHFKSRYPRATVRNIMNSFVTEINRAFGFVKQTEIETYLNSRRQYLEGKDEYGTNQESKDFNQYDLLDADDQHGRNPAPSDKFLTTPMHRQKKRLDRNMVHLQEEIINIRKSIDAEFRQYTNEAAANNTRVVSFIDTIRTYTKELANAKNDKEEYSVVLRLIQGANNLSVNSPDKIVMAHEAVAAPLAVLYNVYKVLAKYNALLHGGSLVNISRWSRDKQAAAAVAAAVNAIYPVTGAAGDPLGIQGAIVAAGAGAIDHSHRNAYLKMLQVIYYNDNINNFSNCHMFVNAAVGNVLQVAQDVPAGYFTRVAAVNANAALNANDINAKALLRDLLTALLDLCANPNKLMSCSIAPGGAVNIEWSGLEELCNNLLQQVKINLNKLRIEFSNSETRAILDKYESKDNCGSIRWLEENLIEILFKDRDKCGLNVGHDHLRQTLDMLTGRVAVQFNPGAPVVGRTFNDLDSVLRELIYYDSVAGNYSLPNDHVTNDLTTFPFNVLPIALEDNVQTSDQKVMLQQLKNKGDVLPAEANAVVVAPVLLFDSPATLNEWNLTNHMSKSLLVTFNKMVHMYLYDNLDDNTLKIYTPLFESFMNSVASKEVVQNLAFPNVGQLVDGKYGSPANRATAANTPLSSPPDGTVLYASTALTMKALITNMDMRLKRKKHMYDSLSDVPEYMKERMKANLPLYSKMFGLVYDRVELLRQFLNNTNLKLNIASSAAAGNNIQHKKENIGADLQDISGFSTERMTAYLNSLLTHLSDLSVNIRKCCDGVYKELQDTSPYFMDMSKDFINDYKQRHGVLPLMPASHVLLPQLSHNGAYSTLAANARPGLATAANARPGFSVPNDQMIRLQNQAQAARKALEDVIVAAVPALVLVGAGAPAPPPVPVTAAHVNHLLTFMNGACAQVEAAVTAGALAAAAAPGGFTQADIQTFIRHHLSTGAIAPNTTNSFDCAEFIVIAITTGVGGAAIALPAIGGAPLGAPDVMDAHIIQALRAAPPAQLGAYIISKRSYEDAARRSGLPALVFGGAESDQIAWSKQDEQRVLLPNRFNGSNPYKYNLASRLVLVRCDVEPQLDHMPGAKDVYNGYASVAQKNSMITAQEYSNTVKHLVNLSRFLNDGAVYSKLFDKTSVNLHENVVPETYLSNSMFNAVLCKSKQMAEVWVPGAGVAPLVAPAPGAATNLAQAQYVMWRNGGMAPGAANAVGIGMLLGEFNNRRHMIDPQCYQFRNKVLDMVNLVENSNKSTARTNFIEHTGLVVTNQLQDNRSRLRVFNILDMNIVPLNVHAFMKEVPFTNILNYSYTFDRMVHDFVLPTYVVNAGVGINTGNIMIPSAANANSTREMLVKLLVHPFSNLSNDVAERAKQYYGLIGSLFNGNDDLKLGRPRYLSDQLWHKVLLTSSAQFAAGALVAQNPHAANRRTQADFYPNDMSPLEAGPAAYEATRAVVNYRHRGNANEVGYSGARLNAVNFMINSTAGLKYFKKNDNGQGGVWRVADIPAVPYGPPAPVPHNLSSVNVQYCAELGKMRFDTKLVRNLTWLVQLQRIMRVVLINHLSWLNTPVVKGLKIADPVITEFNGNDQYDNDDFTGARYDVI